MSQMCACGRPLHYSDLRFRQVVEHLIREHGEFVVVPVGCRRYKVQRHYIALHALNGLNVAEIRKLGFEECSAHDSAKLPMIALPSSVASALSVSNGT